MTTPVLFLIFNRHELAARVFEQIREAKPSRLFIAADGPRKSVAGEDQLCRETRACVESMIDWPCEVNRLYREENMGCQKAPSLAIDWFFSHVTEGIILEDDTVPHPSFFRFSATLLQRYRDYPDVMHISGNNFQFGRIRGDGAYYASRFAHSWGWASWRRAWMLYDISMPGFPEDWDFIASCCGFSSPIKEWWREALDNARSGFLSAWDLQWHFTLMKNLGISLIPNQNLVVNIGVGDMATHTKKKSIASSIRMSSLNRFDPPSHLFIDNSVDQFDFNYAVTNNPLPWRNLNEVSKEILFKLKYK